ncbi:hypothetical protein Syun_021117 [Stephania yunnanensis]|uniref:Uncharacterized protein n=1 Tax=Stephania yunnanensis TaxID=152371 RepID=A0AAP0IFG9_9MAGN
MAHGKCSRITMKDYFNSKEQAQVEQPQESDETSEPSMPSSDEGKVLDFGIEDILYYKHYI